MNNFLISYANTDRPWAEWISWVLEEHGYTVATQLWELAVGNNFVEEMQQAIDGGQQVLVIWSKNYPNSVIYSLDNWLEASSQSRSQLILIQVEDFNQPRVLSSQGYIDLVNASEVEAEQAILAGLQECSEPKSSSLQDGLDGLEEIIRVEESSGGTLKQRRQSYTVQFFLEQLPNNVGMEMMLIPAGTFLMGSPEEELERVSWEGPQHEVSVPSCFMGKYPVTQEQWRVVAELPQVSRVIKLEPSNFKGDRRPVEQVSWEEAVEFCERLSTYTGREYRLPTEAEWEYACRAGTTTPFHFGETITTDLANYRGTDNEQFNWSGSYGQGPKGEYRGETTPVDYFGIANAFGLCDMHGNVLEWCQDQWYDSYKGAPIDGSAWLTEDNSTVRVYRGGSWYGAPSNCRSAYRDSYSSVDRNYLFGFRVVCSAP